ncbi:helix-turn-helix domain-containing protein [Mucilaginibacter calamicampi]|uniref:Helix-turn-helix domain-containing protein n=1 Tax=Mucilaginibacter calamicampi TaxID=1302352 RepID=A0ABW2Z0F6_9SPHI
MNISIGIIDFLMLALVVQGLILAIVLAFSSGRIHSNRYIAAFIFVVAESTLLMELDYLGLVQKYPWLLTAVVPLNMALGPLVYLYARSLAFGAVTPRRKILIHFVPTVLYAKHQVIFILYVLGVLSVPLVSNLYVLPITQKILFGFNSLSLIPAFLSLVIYSLVTYNMVSGGINSEDLSAYRKADLKWIKMLVQIVFVLISIWFVSIVAGYLFPIPDLEPWFHYCLYIPAIVFVYWLGMMVYKRQRIMSRDEMQEYIKQPVKTHFKDDEASDYYDQLKKLMIADNLYMNPVLKVDMLAARLSIPEKGLSNLLNQYVGKNFNDFVNEFRVEEAKRKLIDPRYGNFTIAAIALECGFNSLATFQRVFKQITGVTPSQYQTNAKKSFVEK